MKVVRQSRGGLKGAGSYVHHAEITYQAHNLQCTGCVCSHEEATGKEMIIGVDPFVRAICSKPGGTATITRLKLENGAFTYCQKRGQ
jgi:hypothetical protein